MNISSTASSLVFIIPDVINILSSFKKRGSIGFNAIITSATMFAVTISNFP